MENTVYSFKEKESVPLNATIRYSENQLVIPNSDVYNWSNVRFETNTGTLRRGYILEANVMEAGKT